MYVLYIEIPMLGSPRMGEERRQGTARVHRAHGCTATDSGTSVPETITATLYLTLFDRALCAEILLNIKSYSTGPGVAEGIHVCTQGVGARLELK